MHKNTWRFWHKSFAYVLSLGVLLVSLAFLSVPANASPGINQQLNFQGRLFNSQGATVADGYYNIEFKIYQDGDGQSIETTGSPLGSPEWTESHLNANSQGVTVKNGFLSVELGSITAFGSNIDWNQDTLWLSINIGDTNVSCTPFSSCNPDGEMLPMKRLSSTPFSLNSGMLNGKTSSQFIQLAQGVQEDASTNTSSIYINKTGTGNLITLQSDSSDVFTLTNGGDIAFGANDNHSISVANTAEGVAGKSLTISAGSTTNSGTGAAGGNLILQGGNAAGSGDNNGGGITISGGTGTGSGTKGLVNLSASAFTSNTNASCSSDCSISQSNVDNYGTVIVHASTASITITLPPPTNTTTSGRIIYVTSDDSSQDFTLSTNSDGNIITVGMSKNTTATMIWNGSNWTPAGVSTGGVLSGMLPDQFVQLAQGVQEDASTNTSSIFINKTGTGNLIELQSSSTDSFIVTNSGDVTFGNNDNHSISVTTAAADATGKSLTVSAGAAGTGSGALAGGNLVIQGGIGGGTNGDGGNVSIDAGAKNGSGSDGSINIGTGIASTIQIGNTNLSSGTQTINIGNNDTSGGTTNVTIGAGGSATGGTTTLQAKSSVVINTNGVARATIDNANGIYFGNGVTAATPNNFTISSTGSSTTAVTGGSLTVQGGNATVGNANGGNVTISGGTGVGTGVNGLVVMATPTFSTVSNDANCYTGGALVANSCTITSSSVNNSSAVLVGFSAAGKTATMPDPTITTAGRVVYITAANGSSDFTLSVNGGGTGNTIAMRQNTTATMIWNGADWTAAGASSSTTLQSAYDNTMQSAGGAELVVSNTSTTNGLTIRDSSVNPVNGTLLAVQSQSAATLFSVNSNVTEYTTNSGAETAGASSSTFPTGTWSAIGSSTVSRYTTAGNYIATGQASVSVATTTSANDGAKNTLSTSLTSNMNYNVSFSTRLTSGTFTDMNVYYSADGSTESVVCTTSQAAVTSIWTKVNCTFTAPSSGITSSNAILIRQTAGGTSRTFYIDNISVTIAADYNYATDGGVDDADNFSTNWSSVASATVTRSTTVGNDTSNSAQVITTTSNQGVRNKLSINPLTSTLYRITIYSASTTSGFNTFTVRYSRDGGTNFVSCVDYNTQTISSSTSSFTEVTCYITTDSTSATNPYVYFTQTDATGRTFYVDTFSMTLSQNTTPNVQVGSGVNGGPTTLFTLDRSASAPIAANMDSLLGSMYYDTSLGKLQCYEADGWGACGSSPDTVVTISPEYTNAVMHGTGVGTMTSDLCSSTLGINDGSSGQPTICGSNETYNFYKWTSPQASAQTYSIYVTYQLPGTFKEFASGHTSLMGRTDSSNSTVQYQIYRSDSSSGLTACGSAITVSTGSQSSWQIVSASGASDPSTCSFSGGNSIVFKISTTASQNANAYVGNLNFTFSNT